MSARKDPRTGKWFYRVRAETSDGAKVRLYRSPFTTESEAIQAERLALEELDRGTLIRRRRMVVRRPRGNDAKAGIVYFIRASNAMKIGFTSGGVEARLHTLQVGNHEVLSIAGWFFGTEDDEQALHRRFSSFLIQGEWYRAERDLLEFIEALTKK